MKAKAIALEIAGQAINRDEQELRHRAAGIIIGMSLARTLPEWVAALEFDDDETLPLLRRAAERMAREHPIEAQQ